MKTLLRAKLEDKSAVIAIIGLGYVGLPLALAFSEQGFKTIGYDTSVEKIGRLQNGVSDILDIGSERLNRNLLSGNFLVTPHANALLEADAVLICVPTPLNKAMEPDLSFITQAVDVILEHAKSGILVALESTTYPGTTRDVICEAFSNKGFTLGRNFFCCVFPGAG
ncbi:NAD(P)-binding domain-containing protein [Listeria fleischmannii]|uniref:NAD(P)-binding domain-containing protein n=1 Tax=Listeria fleischmannii TaxID=1069827 RepID=UPI0004B5222C|nr:NAD(P)-binding domain-containing protein [Listeria fleischmannii]